MNKYSESTEIQVYLITHMCWSYAESDIGLILNKYNFVLIPNDAKSIKKTNGKRFVFEIFKNEHFLKETS